MRQSENPKVENTDPSGSCRSCPAFAESAFHCLDPVSLDFLQKNKSELSFKKNQAFSERGKPAMEVYCLKKGAAKVHLTGAQGKKSIVRLVAPGDMLGYRCIFSSDSFRGTASSIHQSVACKISKETIFQLIDLNPSFAKELLARMGREIATAEARHQSFCQKNVRERLAEGIIFIQKKFGFSRNTPFSLPLTRNEIANWIGAAKETVIRAFADLKEEKIIETSGDQIQILDYEQLLNLSEATLSNQSSTSRHSTATSTIDSIDQARIQ